MPRSASVCAGKPVLSVNVKFVLIVPVPATAWNVTITVQLAPGARTAAAPVQLLVAMLKYRVVRLPLPPAPGAGRVTPVTVTLAPPVAVLVSVTVPFAFSGYSDPTGKETRSRGCGVAATRATAVPFNATGEPVTVALVDVMVTVPVGEPLAVGENLIAIEQLVPTARVAPQVPPLRLKGAVTATAMPVKPTGPVLVRVSVWFALFVPVRVLPKVNDVGATLAVAVIAPASSTAPISKPPPCGRTLPKKSVVGALTPLADAVPALSTGGVVVE